MNSLAWPNMFNTNGRDTVILHDKEATLSNLQLLLNSERLSLFGDPYYGAALRQIIFEVNNSITVDLLIDELCSTIELYMPQLQVTRNDISVYSDKIDLYVSVNVTYLFDNSTDLYVINLTNNSQEE